MAPVVTVEEVHRGPGRRRFLELPHARAGEDARFAPLVLAWERYRLDPHRNPYLEDAEVALLLARRAGRPAGRIAAHVDPLSGEGRFGYWWADDDAAVATALVDAARTWLEERGCRSMRGPLSWTTADEPGIQVGGFEHAGTTGLPWHPPHLHRLLEELGGRGAEEQPTWSLPAIAEGPPLPLDPELPGQAGSAADARVCLAGIAAVPDLSDALRGATLRGALRVARRARAGDWSTCTVVRCTGDPATAVPALQAAAGAAGYQRVLAPWSPDAAAPPRTVHRRYRFDW